jgi:hypothetical protein
LAQQQIKVVGAGGQTHIIKAAPPGSVGGGATFGIVSGQQQQQQLQPGGTNMSGIAALAAAAAQQGKMVTAGGQSAAIKLVQGPAVVGGAAATTINMQHQSIRMAAGAPVTSVSMGHQTAVIGGQTVRLASPGGAGSGGTLLKTSGGTTATAITGPGGKQIILQKQPGGLVPGTVIGTTAGGVAGSSGQIVTLVKTSQGMQVATMPKGATMVGGQRIVQAAPGKQIPQGATIVKLVNAQGQPGTILFCQLEKKHRFFVTPSAIGSYSIFTSHHRWAQSAMDRWIDTDSIDRYYRSILLVSFSSMLSIHRLKTFLFLIDSIDHRS